MRFVLHLQTIRETQAKHVVIVAMLALNMLTVNQDSKQVNLQLGQTVETALLPQIQCMRVRELDTGYDKVGRCGLKIYTTILHFCTSLLCVVSTSLPLSPPSISLPFHIAPPSSLSSLPMPLYL